MLPKQNRVDKKCVDLLFKGGKFINSPILTFKFIINEDKISPKVSFIVPKSISKLAVKRNLLRRRGYMAISKHILDFRYLPLGLLGVFVFKKYEDDILILENEIKNILNKIH